MHITLTEEEIKKAIVLYVLRASKQVVKVEDVVLLSLDYGEYFEAHVVVERNKVDD